MNDYHQAPDETIEVQLTGWAYGGEALGRAGDGRMVFAPFCIPGERIRGAVTQSRARWVRVMPQEWLETSTDRIDARCPHFTLCGGCHYQHIPYDQQLVTKRDIVQEQLERIAGFSNPLVVETIPSPQVWNYRNHMRFQVTQQGALGLVPINDPIPFSLDTCYLPDPSLVPLWKQIDLSQESGIQQVGMRVGTHGDPMVILHGDMDNLSDVEVDFPASIIWLDQSAWCVLAGDGALSFDLSNHTFRVSPPSFFQVNTSILPELIQTVMQGLNLQSGMTFFDLYAGVGLFSAYAAQRGVRVYAVEEAPSSCADFEVNLQSYDHISLYEAPVELALSAIEAKPDVILVDPPRAGLSLSVMDTLLGMKPSRLVYLSCDLGTFARDAKRLTSGGYRFEQVVPIDLFPQTSHIETLSIWQGP